MYSSSEQESRFPIKRIIGLWILLGVVALSRQNPYMLSSDPGLSQMINHASAAVVLGVSLSLLFTRSLFGKMNAALGIVYVLWYFYWLLNYGVQ